ncbi:MAG: helix-turn-helix transcriptional regulator [Clostridiales bacterium]|jgi:DNA-binding XRE family transcriptional regulator|nr:helix-turn-helix domain-containing protein [Eubacteriales bacterium]MDH7566896.1 helix-turn-helix transcriptional regulator [Clostridiales bacterium]
MGDIGVQIKNARVQMKMTQTELAKQIGKSPQFICDIEAGRKLPSISTLSMLAKILKLSLDKIFLN